MVNLITILALWICIGYFYAGYTQGVLTFTIRECNIIEVIIIGPYVLVVKITNLVCKIFIIGLFLGSELLFENKYVTRLLEWKPFKRK